MTQNLLKTLHDQVFSYKTIDTKAEGSYREKGSKFLAFAFPAASEQAIAEYRESLKKEYYDARHHCYAWVLGVEKENFRVSDDGEPKHSAGDPILGQIRSNELTNILIVVIRYFGGVKLGVGGLVNAYRSAAADALMNAVIVEKEVIAEIEIEYDFNCTPEVMRLVKEYNLTILDQSFDKNGKMKASLRLADKHAATEKLELLQALKMDIQFSVHE